MRRLVLLFDGFFWGGVLTLVLILGFMLHMQSHAIFSAPAQDFEPKAWASKQSSRARTRMARHLVATDALIGQRPEDVRAMLGEDVSAWGDCETGDYGMGYVTGPAPIFDYVLSIDFSADCCVSQAVVYND